MESFATTPAAAVGPCCGRALPRRLQLRPLASRRRRAHKAFSVSNTATVGNKLSLGSDPEQPSTSSSSSSAAAAASAAKAAPARKLTGQEIEEAAMRTQIALHEAYPNGRHIPHKWSAKDLEAAYTRCGRVTSEYAKTFYLGTQLMTPEKARAIWAIYVWCRRTDELVDGPNASRITPAALDRWEERLEAVFEGRPYDALDAALTDTVSKFPVDIQPFRDMIGGMRMDLVKSRYNTYDELYDYCYRVAGTVALMSCPVMGVDPSYKGPLERVYKAALALGTANQLTNILRDVGEDAAQRNRIYVPLDELERFNIAEEEVMRGLFAPSTGRIDDRWQAFMAFQIERARKIFAEAEAGVNLLEKNARWPVWSALILYRQILDGIEANGYDNFTKRAYVPKLRKLASLPLALTAAQMPAKLVEAHAAAELQHAGLHQPHQQH